MTVSAHFYANALKLALGKQVDWLNDSIKVMLVNSAYTPNQNTDIYKDAVAGITSNEVVGTGYTAGGQALTTKTMTESSLVITLDAADVTWASSTITARYAVIFDDTPATNKPLLGYVDFGVDQSSNNGNFTITWNASGIFTITAN